MSIPGPNQPYGSANGMPFPPPAAPEPWRHEHGEDPNHLLDASGHVPQHHEQHSHMIGTPHVVTSADVMRARLLRVLLALVLIAVIAVGVVYVISQT